MSKKVLSREPAFDVQYYDKGIKKIKKGGKDVYVYISNNKPVSKKDKIRIDSLKIPPNWEDVWVSHNPKSKIQATGYDGKGIKQYVYSIKHVENAEKDKFARLYKFIKDEPKLEKAMLKDEKLPPYSYERVIVSMLTIVREVYMRVGKEVYARRNKSYGVSSLRKIHMTIDNSIIKFKFKGKSNKRLSYTIDNSVLAKHLKLLLKLEGDRLFQYINDNGRLLPIYSTDINKYIQRHMGHEYTVKDFRTYAANRYFIKTLLNETRKRLPKNEKIKKKNIRNAINSTAKYMRHTKAISKKSYIMSFAVDLYMDDSKFFVDKKFEHPDDVLMSVLRKYKRDVLN